MTASPGARAADLAMTRTESVRVLRHERVVRDYDGTPIVIRRVPVIVRGYDGSVVAVSEQSEAIAVRTMVAPKYYLNGQPVLR